VFALNGLQGGSPHPLTQEGVLARLAKERNQAARAELVTRREMDTFLIFNMPQTISKAALVDLVQRALGDHVRQPDVYPHVSNPDEVIDNQTALTFLKDFAQEHCDPAFAEKLSDRLSVFDAADQVDLKAIEAAVVEAKKEAATLQLNQEAATLWVNRQEVSEGRLPEAFLEAMSIEWDSADWNDRHLQVTTLLKLAKTQTAAAEILGPYAKIYVRKMLTEIKETLDTTKDLNQLALCASKLLSFEEKINDLLKECEPPMRLRELINLRRAELCPPETVEAGLNKWVADAPTQEQRAKREIARARIVACLTGVEEVDLNRLGLTSLPAELGALTRLKKFACHYNNVQSLPESIGLLFNLTQLNLIQNQLRDLPESIGSLVQLEVLFLGCNQLSTLPPEIGHLAKLQSLDVSQNQLVTLPPEIGRLARLQSLQVSFNQLSELPAEIGDCSQLRGLYVTDNNLRTLPVQISRLSELRDLWLWGNQLETLPADIGLLFQLEQLSVMHNPLKSLPDSISRLPNNTNFSIGPLGHLDQDTRDRLLQKAANLQLHVRKT